MEIVIYLLGLGFILYCAYYNLYPRQAVDGLKKIYSDYPLRYLAAFPAIMAVLFIIAAPAARCPYPFWIVGILAAVEAVVAVINPKGIYSCLLDWYFGTVSEQVHKIFAIAGIIFGTLILTLPK